MTWLLVNFVSAELVLSPHIGNLLGGTPVLVCGVCVQPSDFILCTFDGDQLPGAYFDDNTIICSTPIMTTTGTVDVAIRAFRFAIGRIFRLSTTFTTGKYGTVTMLVHYT